MRALSLWQPWASLIAIGLKRHETRHWPTRLRGPVAIHAAKTLDLDGAPHDLCTWAWGEGWVHKLPLGAVVAVADLTACHPADRVVPPITIADEWSGNFKAGRFAFRLDDVRPLAAPIPLKGRQGFFDWADPGDLRLLTAVDHLEVARRWLRETG